MSASSIQILRRCIGTIFNDLIAFVRGQLIELPFLNSRRTCTSVKPTGLRPRIHNVLTMNTLSLQGIFKMFDKQAEKGIHDLISFMNLLEHRSGTGCKDHMVL